MSWSAWCGAALALLLGFGSTCQPVAAQSCTASASGLAFGTVDVLSGASAATSGSVDLSCSGTPAQTVRVCVNIAGATLAGKRFMTAASSTTDLFYDLFQDSGDSILWGSYPSGGTGVQIDVPLDASGNGSASHPIYGAIYAGQQTTQVGAYTAAFQGTAANITAAYGTLLGCNAISTNEAPLTFGASASVGASCNVSATTLDFGSVTSLATEVDGTSAISVQCTNGSPYSVSLDGGLTQVTDPTQRSLVSGPNVITYGVYQDAAHRLGWGHQAGVDVATGTGTAARQSFVAYGRIPPQSNPLVGTYHDTIVVTVGF